MRDDHFDQKNINGSDEDELLDDLKSRNLIHKGQNSYSVKNLALEKVEKPKKINSRSNKKTFKLKYLIKNTIIAIMLITITAVISTSNVPEPVFIKIQGSDSINYFYDEQSSIPRNYELLKKYSSEVGVTARGRGYNFTIDNIAFDGVYLSVFYTIATDHNMIQEAKDAYMKWNVEASSHFTIEDQYVVQSNFIGVRIPEADLMLF